MLHSRVAVSRGWMDVRTQVQTVEMPATRTAVRGRWAVACAALLACAAALAIAAGPDNPDPGVDAPPALVALVDAGDFAGAERRIAAGLTAGADPATRRALDYQRERMRRILLDFTLDAAAAKAGVRRQVPDLTDAEFARWDAAGLLERRVIDGRTLYFNRAASNLFRLSAEARARRADPKPFHDSPFERPHAHHEEVRTQALETGKSSVAPRRVRVTQSLTIDADAVPAGETVRAWIPFPRSLPGQQDDIRLLATEPAAHTLAPEETLQRTVSFEKAARAGEPTEFSVSYELTVSAQYADIDPGRVRPVAPTPELAPFLAERPPHVVFSDAMRLHSARIVGDETNPYRIARKLFDAVDGIPWAGAREYSTISNIGQHALDQGHADCGQQTLLLITLLRMNGIPARWQSGWIFSDAGYDNMHDWGWLYLAPYGWVPMDVTFGRLPGATPGLAGFYLGGFDAYRIAFNDDWSRPLVPAKRHVRSETVDLQRGEAEWAGGNLYFDQWDYDFAWQMLPPDAG